MVLGLVLVRESMNTEQISLIRKLIRGKEDSIAYLAAKAVLVDGKSQTLASQELNAKISAVQNGVSRYKAIDEQIRIAYAQKIHG